ncbi:M61 family metallopeptidase [Dyadobacter sp. 22481]|uniref:M61 family metallopeptidase n=1 Tax=Dyadobacter sp. 22481 TaxID=3453926 RepID=UPI003F85181F
MKSKKTRRWLCLLASHCLVAGAIAQKLEPIRFTVSMPEPANHTFHVTMDWKAGNGDSTRLKLPDWQPGYYQLMDYASNIDKLVVKDENDNALRWVKSGRNGWAVATKGVRSLHAEYDVKTARKFVATSYLDEEHGYITPVSMFMHEAGKLKMPSEVTIKPYNSWDRVATGLDSVAGKSFTYRAPDFDILYDSPLLTGNLEELRAFEVKGIPHRFIGYKLGDFDRTRLMSDIQKIVEKSSALIGDIPYKHYTFIAIGPGQGGIEHLNSTTISFSGDQLNSRGWNGMLRFITHEYFHHYNVKRIRPVELGPFDYDKGSRTNMLWVSEGLTVYYEPLIMRAAGLMGEQELLDLFKKQIADVETKPGRFFQTLAQASAETWSDGPFGRTGDAVNKTISYYQKGPVVGLLFDLAIRYETKNKRSLDDVMRKLYQDFYIKKNRGFTEAELRSTIEAIAGTKLDELFSYIYTTAEPDYKKYLGYAGLDIDVTTDTHYGTFEITKMASPSALQREIFRSWSRGD